MQSIDGTMEFASRYIWRGTDFSPVSFRLLAAARQSGSQLPSFFRRVGEFRQVRLAEFFRVMGAGYRVLAQIGSGYRYVARPVVSPMASYTSP